MEVNRSKFISLVIYFISCFLFSRVTNEFRFFWSALVLKGSSLRGSFLLSTALFVSGEVLIGARAKRGLIWAEFSKKIYFHGLESAWDIIKSGNAQMGARCSKIRASGTIRGSNWDLVRLSGEFELSGYICTIRYPMTNFETFLHLHFSLAIFLHVHVNIK